MVGKTKQIIGKIHLWLGLISGMGVFVIALTGSIYAFQAEIQDILQAYRFVSPQHGSFLPPSSMIRIANRALPGKQVHAVMYEGADRSARVIYWSPEHDDYYFVYINPYTGSVLKVKNENRDFFRIILEGHYYLWLPPAAGQQVVAAVTLIFVVMLFSGMVLWWPGKLKGSRQRFRIKWDARWRRKNYDLHYVTGFYIFLLCLVLAFTGLIWGYQWFRDGVYAILPGGGEFVEYYTPRSEQTGEYPDEQPAIDKVWRKMLEEYPQAAWIEIHPPADSLSAIAANANPDASTYWKTDYRYFDQYTMEEHPVGHIWNRFDESAPADKLIRMNYDIHTGAILGFPGKFLACMIGLLIASLPVTGILIWAGRKKKKKSAAADLNIKKKKTAIF